MKQSDLRLVITFKSFKLQKPLKRFLWSYLAPEFFENGFMYRLQQFEYVIKEAVTQ